jgi:hypothetical protein
VWIESVDVSVTSVGTTFIDVEWHVAVSVVVFILRAAGLDRPRANQGEESGGGG